MDMRVAGQDVEKDSTPEVELAPALNEKTPEEREAALLALVREKASLPAMGLAVSKVLKSLTTETESVHDLANFILADVSLTQQVLKASNSVAYRRGGQPCSMISKAILRIGFGTVKSIATASALLDSLADGAQAGQLKAEFAQSFFASVMAREVVRRANYRNSEEVAISALFKNLGKMLLAKSDFSLYQQIKDEAAATETCDDTAALKVTGVRYSRLTELILREWSIPDHIVAATLPAPPSDHRSAPSREDWLRSVVSFSAEAARSISQESGRDKAREISLVLSKYSDTLSLDKSKFDALVDTVGQETISLTAGMGLPTMNYTQAKPAPVPGQSETAMEDAFPGKALADIPSSDGASLDLLTTGVQETAAALAADGTRISDVVDLVLESLLRGLSCQHVALCIRDCPAKVYKAKTVLGDNWQEVQSSMRFPDEYAPDLFHAALSQNADLQIRDLHDPKIAERLPVWFRKTFPATKSFILLPLVVNTKVLGFIYADKTRVMSQNLSKEKLGLIKTLRSQLVMAIKLLH